MHSCGQLQTRYRKTKHPTATLRLLFSFEILSDSFCNPMDSSTPGSSVHGILQATTLEWPFPSPGDPPNPGIEPASPALAGRFLRVLWTMRSKQSILKEISPKYSLEGLMLKLQYFGHLMRRIDSLEKTLMLGKTDHRRRRERQRMRWLDGIMTKWARVWVNSGREWRTGKPGVLQSTGSQRVGRDLATKQQQNKAKQAPIHQSKSVF